MIWTNLYSAAFLKLELKLSSGTLIAARQDPTQERPAPPHPTSISFPRIEFLPEAPQAWDAESAPDLLQPYSRIRKLSDVSDEHLRILNVSLQPNIESNIERLFPTNEIAKAFLPPSEWSETPTTVPASVAPDPTSKPARVLSNGRPYPSQHEFSVRIKELKCVNEDAFRALIRTPQAGPPPVRLAHYRRFWEALSQSASYWDTSRDEYFPEKSVEKLVEESTKRENGLVGDENAATGTNEPRKRSRPNTDLDDPAKDFELPLGSPPPAAVGAQPSTIRASLDVPPPKAPNDPEKPPGTYRGYRISNGSSIPDSYRIDATRAFLEPIAWAFGFTLSGHRRPPVLEIKKLLVPIKLSGTVWRAPNQREKARAGYLQGPVFGISCRSDTEFAEGKSNSTLDTLRELGALLCLAQERAREGLVERKPGEGKWWTSVPRWGGGPGGELGDAISDSGDDKKDEIELAMEEMMPKDPDGRGRSGSRSSGAKRKLALANAWKTLRVSVGYWDPRTEYCAVGKSATAEWDEVSFHLFCPEAHKLILNLQVFLLSSLNHHLSLVKLKVHKHYLRYLLAGEWPIEAPNQDWSIPVMSRTKWYDLFNPDERSEMFKILWGAMGYLARSDA